MVADIKWCVISNNLMIEENTQYFHILIVIQLMLKLSGELLTKNQLIDYPKY